jgi:pimeloyl-ACP methyl ester carboxylesterase
MPGDFSDVLKRLSAACASQPECQTAFPDVEPTFWRTVNALRREPLTRQVTRSDGITRTATITAPRFAGAIHAALERLQTAVPMLVHAVHARDERVLNEVTRALTRTAEGRSGASPGMAHTVTCFEEAPLATSELRQRARNRYSPVLTDEGVFAGPDGCDALHPYRAAPEQLAAVKSDIPTLIFTGEFDLQTHRSNGPLVAASLKNSQLVEIPAVAHVQSFRHECTRALMRDFHDAPGQKVDTRCLKSIPPLRFVTDVKQLAPPQSPQARSFENAPCPFTADAKVMAQVRCGYVTVPENRAAPQGRQLELAVAVMKSLSPSPRPDPVVVVGGGPGDRMVDRVPGYVTNRTMDAVRAERDVIVYDQRGAGYSEPKFCPEASAEMAARRGGVARGYRDVQRQQLARCGEYMRSAGYDLSQYNSIASAHDLTDLRRALGYEQWNLRAASYGTRLALVAMRVAPQGIRSAVFDGPVPPNRAGWFNKPADFADVLERLSAACAAQPACNAAFPDVERTFWRAVEEHERAPRTRTIPFPNGSRTTVTVDGAAIAASAVDLIERGMHQALPIAIHAAASGNEAVLTTMTQMLARGPGVGLAGSRMGLGLHYAVNCFEEAPLNTVELQQHIRKAHSPVLTDRGVFPDPTLCEGLHAFRAVPADLESVESTIPTLIFTGEFDLQTHRSNGEVVARSLKSHQLAEIPGAGHVQSWRHECTRTMMRDFYNAPGQKVDASCLKSIPPLRFLTDMMGIAK